MHDSRVQVSREDTLCRREAALERAQEALVQGAQVT